MMIPEVEQPVFYGKTNRSEEEVAVSGLHISTQDEMAVMKDWAGKIQARVAPELLWIIRPALLIANGAVNEGTSRHVLERAVRTSLIDSDGEGEGDFSDYVHEFDDVEAKVVIDPITALLLAAEAATVALLAGVPKTEQGDSKPHEFCVNIPISQRRESGRLLQFPNPSITSPAQISAYIEPAAIWFATHSNGSPGFLEGRRTFSTFAGFTFSDLEDLDKIVVKADANIMRGPVPASTSGESYKDPYTAVRQHAFVLASAASF